MRSAGRPAENAGMTRKPFANRITPDGWRAIHASMVNMALMLVVSYITVRLNINAGIASVVLALVVGLSFRLHARWHGRLDRKLEEQP